MDPSQNDSKMTQVRSVSQVPQIGANEEGGRLGAPTDE